MRLFLCVLVIIFLTDGSCKIKILVRVLQDYPYVFLS